jgi:hypothetical protein
VLGLCFKALRKWTGLLLNCMIFEGGFGGPRRKRVPGGMSPQENRAAPLTT